MLTKFGQNLWWVSILRVDLTWNDPPLKYYYSTLMVDSWAKAVRAGHGIIMPGETHIQHSMLSHVDGIAITPMLACTDIGYNLQRYFQVTRPYTTHSKYYVTVLTTVDPSRGPELFWIHMYCSPCRTRVLRRCMAAIWHIWRPINV